MHRIIKSLVVVLSIGAAGAALARDIEDNKLLVYPQKDNKYKVTDVIGDKVTFYGVAAEVWERKHITGLLLKKGENATAEQKHIVYVTAKNLKIDAFVEIDGKEQPIVEAAPVPAPAPAAAPAPEAAPQPAPTADATAQPAPAAAPAPAVDPNKH
jgi:hypothetical protein